MARTRTSIMDCPPLPPDEQKILEDADLEPLVEEHGWGLLNLDDAHLPLLKGLPSITALVLFESCESGDVTDAGLSALAGNATLRQLHLGPGITDAGLAHLAGLVGLRQLRLDSAEGVTDAGLQHLARLTALESLSVQYTGIGDEGLRSIEHLLTLRELEINNTNVTDDGLASLEGFPSLTVLHLGGRGGIDRATGRPSPGGVTDRGLRHLASSTKLETLSLDGGAAGEITSEGVKALAPLSALRMLLLRGPGIDDDCVTTLAGLTALERLFLTDTRISKPAIERLRAALPGCTITPPAGYDTPPDDTPRSG